jgi:hypothetical protein
MLINATIVPTPIIVEVGFSLLSNNPIIKEGLPSKRINDTAYIGPANIPIIRDEATRDVAAYLNPCFFPITISGTNVKITKRLIIGKYMALMPTIDIIVVNKADSDKAFVFLFI